MFSRSKDSSRPRQRRSSFVADSQSDSSNDIQVGQERRSSLRAPKTSKASKPNRSSSFIAALMSRFVVLIVIVAVLFGLYNITRLNSSSEIKPVANDYQLLLRDTAIYKKSADQFLQDSVFNLNKVTVDSSGLSQSLLRKYPELSAVYIGLPLGSSTPVVNVEAAKPSFMLVNKNGMFVVGSNGKLLASADEIPTVRSMKLPKIKDNGVIEPELGKQILSSKNAHFIDSVYKILESKGIKIAAAEITPTASEIDLNVANTNYVIKMNLQSDTPKEQVGTLLATIKQLQKSNVVPAKYIDVRVPGRAYYQ